MQPRQSNALLLDRVAASFCCTKRRRTQCQKINRLGSSWAWGLGSARHISWAFPVNVGICSGLTVEGLLTGLRPSWASVPSWPEVSGRSLTCGGCSRVSQSKNRSLHGFRTLGRGLHVCPALPPASVSRGRLTHLSGPRTAGAAAFTRASHHTPKRKKTSYANRMQSHLKEEKKKPKLNFPLKDVFAHMLTRYREGKLNQA